MDGMPTPPAHAKPAPRDHMWVLVLVAACALAPVWGSWVGIGAVSGFPKLGRLSTDWTLAVVVEAYWGYALYAWLAAAAGPRSRAFAMWSAAGVFLLSLAGQASYHLTAVSRGTAPPPVVVVFVSALPVTILALIAVLIHLRHIDRAEAAEAEREAAAEAERVAAGAAAADERTALRAELEAQQEALAAAQADRDAAQREAAETTAKAEVLARKLAAAAAKGTRKPQPKKGTPAPATKVPRDVDVQAEALSILAADPDISGADLGERVGRSERWGQTFKKNLAGSAAGPGDDNQETS
jgi:hypothetical protein